MDGGIADSQGEPFPLVCTTGKDVIRNLTKSLDSYVGNAGKRRKAILATSQELTPPRQRNLYQRAREKGFELIGVYDRHAMKDHLYQNPRWCLKLLNLTGEPPALSTVPRTTRPSPELGRVGRESDLEWLRSTEGDRLLVGQPGSGKTYLLRDLVREGGALFLVSDERAEIANALRERRPALVIVDDAHRDLEILERLYHLREELGAEQEVPIFSIAATCWPGAENEVRAGLGRLPSKQVRHLELMIRREILEIVEQLGADWTPEWKRLLVNQAANKPGVAVTLAWLCLRGDWHEVATGEALWRELGPTFNKLVTGNAADFLGVLSLGGKRGMALEDVGNFLGWGRQQTREVAIGLASGGILKELPDRRLVVEPADLRSALLKHTFFEGPAPFRYQDLLGHVPDRGTSIFEIVRAVHQGAELPPEELRTLVSSTTDHDAWRGVAALKEHTHWALREAPFDPLALVQEALFHSPSAAVQLLLERAVGDSRPLHSHPDHPLRILKDWLEEPIEDTRDILARRRLGLEEARRFLDRGGDRGVAIHAACLTLSPKLEGTVPEALDRSFSLLSGVLPSSQMQELGKLWKTLLEMLREVDLTTWTPVVEMLKLWIRPRTSEANMEIAHSIAKEILQDLRLLVGDNQGLRAELRRLARHVDSDLTIEVDPIFELLYMDEVDDVDDWRELREKKRATIQEYAHEWASGREPHKVIGDLVRFEQQAAWVQRPAGSWPQLLCSFLADPDFALAMALAEWTTLPRGEFREEVREACQRAILRSADGESAHRGHDEYQLGEILASDPDLAFEWLRRYLRQGDTGHFLGLSDREAETQAISALRRDQKLAILEEVEPKPVLYALIPRLVNREPDLYQRLLAQSRLEKYYLHPLQGIPGSAWAELAQLALDHGLEPEAIANAAYLGTHSIYGYGQSYWRQWHEAFAILEEHPDVRLREIGRLGRQSAQKNIETADERQHRDDLEGFCN